MPKMFIDTNVFLDFYRLKKDSFKILKDLHQYSDSIIFPSLVYDEFLRNRVNVIKVVISKLKDEKSQSPIPAFFEDLGIFEELVKSKREYKKCLDTAISKLHEMVKDYKKDVVFSELSKLYNPEKIKIYEYDESIIDKARKRHLLGQPPGTDTVNICDEVIWETILSNIDDDIVIVARDGTYKDNYFYLSQEVKNKTNKNLIKVADSINKGLKLLGKDITDEQIELEEKQIESLKWENFLDAGWISHDFVLKVKSGGWDPNLNKYEWNSIRDDNITTGARSALHELIKKYTVTTDWLRKTDRKEALKKLSKLQAEINGEDTEE